jgi:DNA-binding MarR family transcriptional regulator
MALRRQPPGRSGATAGQAVALADRLHSAAIHLLRRLRAQDEASGLSAPRLSALSVIVFRGPITLGELAHAEQVRPPTITRLVQELEREGLVRRRVDSEDRRIQRVSATAAGKRILQEGRARRVAALAASVRSLTTVDRRLLERATVLLERVVRDRPATEANDVSSGANVRSR